MYYFVAFIFSANDIGKYKYVRFVYYIELIKVIYLRCKCLTVYIAMLIDDVILRE